MRYIYVLLLLLLSSVSPLCRVSTLTRIFLRQTISQGTLCCSYSDVTIHGAHIASSCVDSISTFRSMCAVPNMAVFCSSLTS
jgi:hypothetical protein